MLDADRARHFHRRFLLGRDLCHLHWCILAALAWSALSLALTARVEAGDTQGPDCPDPPRSACVFAAAERLARTMDPAGPQIVKVAVAKGESGDFESAHETLGVLPPGTAEHDDGLRRLSVAAAAKGMTSHQGSQLAAIENLRTREIARRESAIAYAQAGYLEEARHLLSKLTLPEDRASVLAEIALSAELSGETEVAETLFAEALSSVSQSQLAISGIGIALAKAKKFEEAVSLSERLAPGTALYALQIAIVASLLESNEVTRALDVIDAIDNPGIRKAARLRVVGFLVETGRDARAREILRTFPEGGRELTALLAYARALARRGDSEAALAMTANLDEAARSPVYYAITRRQIAEGDTATARISLERVANGRQRQDLMRLIALAEWEAGDSRRAFATASAIEPDLPRLSALLELAQSMSEKP